MKAILNNTLLHIILIIFIIIIAVKLYLDSDSFNLRCIISDVNGNTYCVRDRNKIELAADRLAIVNNNLNKLVNHLSKKYPEKDNVQRLINGYNPKKIYEALHEVSHIATKSIGHTDEFWQNFKFMITEAKAINIYTPVDYKKNAARYCGMNISDNPYYDVK